MGGGWRGFSLLHGGSFAVWFRAAVWCILFFSLGGAAVWCILFFLGCGRQLAGESIVPHHPRGWVEVGLADALEAERRLVGIVLFEGPHFLGVVGVRAPPAA